jgi:putative nucleotidyltransferase with HDIG domain
MDQGRFNVRKRLADFREWVDRRNTPRFRALLLTAVIVCLTLIICSAFFPTLRGFSEGAPAPRTITAGEAVTALDVAATEELRTHVADLVEPVYLADPSVAPAAAAELEAFLTEVERVRQTVAGGTASGDAVAALALTAPSTASMAVLEYLVTADASAFAKVREQALGALETLYAGRITEDAVESARLSLRAIVDQLTTSPEAANAVYEVAAGYVRANQVLDEVQTAVRREAAMAQVVPVTLSVREGETVVKEGEVVTAQHALILEALGLTGTRYGWKVWLGVFLLVLLETGIFSRMLRRFNRENPDYTNNMMLAMVFLLVVGTLLARLLMIRPLSAYIIPTAAAGMVAAVVLNARSAFLTVTLVSLNIGLMTDFDMRYAVVSLLVGGVSLYLVSKVTKRAALMGAAAATMVTAAFTIFAVELFIEASLGQALRMSLWGLANGFLAGVLTILLLLLLETVLNLTTPLRMLELADPAHPLLKKLMQVAPGTYNHSIFMGNLAEAAAEAIGANPALARVGAYYHDIGKTVRPEYFVENQIYVGNPHDHLSPSLSKLAITAHVRDGEDLGRLYGLPKPVVDIIKQHHGTSVLSYFFHRARETSKDPVYEESFRYEGEKPKSREAAIIMLADSVEAAVRALEVPTRRKIQGLIQEIVKQKVQDGQLDESALTQSDLHAIVESFDKSLLGLLGHRISYPDRTDQVDDRKKSLSVGKPPGSKARENVTGDS